MRKWQKIKRAHVAFMCKTLRPEEVSLRGDEAG